MEQTNKPLRYCYAYPHPSVTTDCVVFGYDGERLHVLLIERGVPPYKGCWAFPGGFLNVDESADEGARRELEEETGLKVSDICQFHSFSDPERDPRERVITIAYYTLVPVGEVKGSDDAARAQWFPLDNVPPLAFDHDSMLALAIDALRRRLFFEPLGTGVLPEMFTFAQWQQLYAAIVGSTSDMQRLFEKMLQFGVIVADNAKDHTDTDAKPILYKFVTEAYAAMRSNRFLMEW